MSDDTPQSDAVAVPSPVMDMADLDWRLRDALFRESTARDQANYYIRTAEKNTVAARQVNQIRATLSLLTGVASALVALLVQTYHPLGIVMEGFVKILIVLSVALPAIAAGFNTLADLYQWDRTTRIYRTARDVIKFADSHEPIPEEEGKAYRDALLSYSRSVLKIMEDEQAQWGLNIRVPKHNIDFTQEQISKSAQAEKPA